MITTSVLIGFIAFFLHAILVLLWLRLIKMEPVMIHILDSVLVHMITIFGAYILFPGIPYWQGAGVYWFLVLGYLYGYSAFYTSVSLSILYQITKDPQHTMLTQTIYERYVLGSFLERANMLVESGQAENVGGKFVISPAGVKAAHMIQKIQRVLFGVEASGLYFVDRSPKSEC